MLLFQSLALISKTTNHQTHYTIFLVQIINSIRHQNYPKGCYFSSRIYQLMLLISQKRLPLHFYHDRIQKALERYNDKQSNQINQNLTIGELHKAL